MNRAQERFAEIYKKDSEYLIRTPYRVCPLGAHSDHQYGLVSGFAIDKYLYLAYSPKHNGVVELNSLQFSKRAQWSINNVPPKKENDWADYLRGATIALSRRYPLFMGLSGVIDGELPIGGLSSSAAVILSFLKALCNLNRIELEDTELIEIAQEAENKYVGVSCGKLDQSCEVYCKKDSLLYLDTLTNEFENIKVCDNAKPYKIAIFFSGLERNLTSSKFNTRTDECKAASYMLKGLAGLEYGKFEDSRLRDVPREIFEKYREKLPENFRKRATHFYTEFERVQKGKEYWVKGDIDSFGKLMFESGESSINNYEVGSEQLTFLYRCIAKQKGVYGARFSGAGFKGCCFGLIDPAYADDINKAVEEEYTTKFPELKGKYEFFVCDTTDGIGK